MRRGRTVREFRETMRKKKQSVNPARQKRINRIKASAEEYTKKRNETVPTSLNEETSDSKVEVPF